MSIPTLDRRSFVLGSFALVATPSLAHARAWGANGWMTRRVRNAEAAGRQVHTDGKSLEDNPFEAEGSEFDAWAKGFALAAALSSMTPSERAAHDARKRAEVAAFHKMIDRQNDRFHAIGFVLGALAVGSIGFCIWIVRSALDTSKKIDGAAPFPSVPARKEDAP